MQNFLPSHFAPAGWGLVSQTGYPASPLGTPVILNVKGHTLDLSVMLFDVTHTGTGGVRARIAGPLDAKGVVEADLDLDLTPWNPSLQIKPGLRGIALFAYAILPGGVLDMMQVPVIVEKLHTATQIDAEVKWNMDVSMDALAGLLIYPAL